MYPYIFSLNDVHVGMYTTVVTLYLIIPTTGIIVYILFHAAISTSPHNFKFCVLSII